MKSWMVNAKDACGDGAGVGEGRDGHGWKWMDTYTPQVPNADSFRVGKRVGWGLGLGLELGGLIEG